MELLEGGNVSEASRNESKRGSVQICFNIASGSLYIRSNGRLTSKDNLVSNIKSQDVVVFAENVDSLKILIENVCTPGGRTRVNRTVERKSKVDAVGTQSKTVQNARVSDVHSINSS